MPLRRRMLRLVVENLLENALRYAGEGATCTVTLAREPGRRRARRRRRRAGVPDEDVPRLFERFFRSDRARTTRGTGLGLAIVKHVVESAGGNVEARGGRAAGSTFGAPFRSDLAMDPGEGLEAGLLDRLRDRHEEQLRAEGLPLGQRPRDELLQLGRLVRS